MTSATGDTAGPHSPFHYVDRPETYHPDDTYEVRVPTGITTKQVLMRQYVRSLKFPKYFGWNWDALDECLRDLSWLADPKPIVVVHEGLPFRAGEDRRRIYLQLLRDQVHARVETDLPVIEVVFGTASREEVERLLEQ